MEGRRCGVAYSSPPNSVRDDDFSTPAILGSLHWMTLRATCFSSDKERGKGESAGCFDGD